MEDSGLRSRRETAELNPRPTIRQLLGSNRSAHGNDHSTVSYSPARTDDIDDHHDSIESTPANKGPPSHSVKSVNTSDTQSDSSKHVLWKGVSVYAMTWEVLGIVISILFLVLGACVANLKDRTESEWSKRVIQATRIAPSIWPILFSGVLGNAVRRFANWRVEHGIPLLALEQLMGSLTMANSIISVLTWSIFKPVSFILIVLWAFNPLGSQASFRGVYLADRLGSGSGRISYYNPNLSLQMATTVWTAPTQIGRIKPTLRALYLSLLYDITCSTQYVDSTNDTFVNKIAKLGGPQAAAIQTAMDPWGNVRIPHLEYSAGYDPANPHQWVSVPWKDAVQNYSSLMGNRIEGVNHAFTGNTTFNITSSYQSFNCSPWITIDESQTDEWAVHTFGYNYSTLVPLTLRAGGTGGTQNRVMPRTFFVASTAGLGYNRTYAGHPQLVFGTGLTGKTPANSTLSYTSCSTGTTYVDSKVTCMSKGSVGRLTCGVDAIRKMLQPPESEKTNLLEAWRIMNETGSNMVTPTTQMTFLASFMDLIDDNEGGSGTSSVIEWYLQDPLTAFEFGMDKFGEAALQDVDVKVVEKRLGLLYNTLWQLGYGYQSATGGNLTTSPYVDTLLNTTSHIVEPRQPVYMLDIPWLVVYFVSVGIMFLAAAVSLVLHTKCHAPPILGYVSSLIRDSVFFGEDNVQGNSTESGTAKAGRLGKMEVMVADVWSAETVGRIAFAPAQGRGVVKEERHYE